MPPSPIIYCWKSPSSSEATQPKHNLSGFRMVPEEFGNRLTVSECFRAPFMGCGKRPGYVGVLQAFLRRRSLQKTMDVSGVEAVTGTHRVLRRYAHSSAPPAFLSFSSDGAGSAKFHHHASADLRKLIDR